MPQARNVPLGTVALATLLLVSAPLLALAQEAQTPSSLIRVLTLDTEGAPIEGLLVQVLGPARQVVREAPSDATGTALLAGLRRGSYELRIISTSYTDVYRVLDLRQAELVVEVTMLPSGVEERVTVTAARGTLQEETKIPATVRSLDEARLKARAVDLLPRMLDEEPRHPDAADHAGAGFADPPRAERPGGSLLARRRALQQRHLSRRKHPVSCLDSRRRSRFGGSSTRPGRRQLRR